MLYKNSIFKIRDYVRNKNVWVSIDETTDVEGRYEYTNVIIGTYIGSRQPGENIPTQR